MPDRQAQSDRDTEDKQSERSPARSPEENRTKRADDARDAKPDAEKKGPEKKEEGGKGKPFRPSKKVIIIVALVFVAIIVTAILYWLHARQFVSTDDAYTTGHVHQISARVSGIVTQVEVDDNQLVDAGAVLVKLDPRDYAAELDRAKAELQQAEAQVTAQEAKIQQSASDISSAEAQALVARAQVDQSSAQLQKAQLDYDRVAGLFQQDKKAVAKSDVDAVTAALNSARSANEGTRANLASANAQAEASRSNAATAKAQLEVAHANVAAAQAAERNAELQLSYCNIVSPVRGKVSKKTVESGQQLAPGQALMAIVPENIWVVANLKETQLTDVKIGQRVDIKVDSLPGKTFIGSVDSIQEGSGATFSLLPPDNATGNFTKIVQRVPVKIVFDETSIREFHDKIVPGLSAEPRIDLRSLKDNKREPKRQEKVEKQNRAAEETK
ncbi:MAG TPA: HlyD family secretion protein [Chthoniobacteraceae bacterium]